MVQIIERLRRKEVAKESYTKGLEYLSWLCMRILHPDFPEGERFQSREVTLIEGDEEFRVRVEYGSRNPSQIGVILEGLAGFPLQVLYLRGLTSMRSPEETSRILERPGKAIWNLAPMISLGLRRVEPDEIEEYKQLLGKVAQFLSVEIPSEEKF